MSARQILANRANARASTGPKTAKGKARVAQNARRHGLALSVMADPKHAAEVESLAQGIAGPDRRPDILHLSRRVAEAQIDLLRIRQARQDRLAAPAFGDRNETKSERPITSAAPVMMTGPSPPAAIVEPRLVSGPLSSQSALALPAELLAEILVFERYERRALSRRKFAIRELDAARQMEMSKGN